MKSARPQYFLIDLMLVIALCGLVIVTIPWAWQIVIQVQTTTAPDEYHQRTFLGLDIGYVIWFLSWYFVRLKRKVVACPRCGRGSVIARKTNHATICYRCRQRALSPIDLKREEKKGSFIILALLAVISVFIGYALSDPVAVQFGRSYWIILPLAAIGVTLAIASVLFLVLVMLLWLKNRPLSSPRASMDRARKVAGDEYAESDLGPIKLWYSGPTDPSPMISGQLATVRGRFAAMVGEETEYRGTLRIFCFHRRESLVSFQRQKLTNFWNLDGIYNPAPARMMSLSTEIIPYRLSDPEVTVRSLFSLVFIDEFKAFPLSAWLQSGINRAMTFGNEGSERLNRKMVVSIAKGTVLGEELFRLKPGAFFKLVMNWSNHRDDARLGQITAQSWSLIEYLGIETASDDRKGRFRAYLKAIRKDEAEEAVFQTHFGHGYDRLLEGWRCWVLERGVGIHSPPSSRPRCILTGRLIPNVLDQRVGIMDRILAIRALGWMGYALGANALIDLLRSGGGIPTEEVVGALESISGLALGDDSDRWTIWWDSLPREVRENDGHFVDEVEVIRIASHCIE